MKHAALLSSGYLGLLVLPALIWYVTGTEGVQIVAASESTEMDRTALGLIGTLVLLIVHPLFALEPLLAARSRRLDQVFGLDQVYLFHKAMAMTGALLLLLYPVLIARLTGNWGSIVGLQLPWEGMVLRAAVALVLLQALSSLLPRIPGFDHERWRSLHNRVALLVLLALALQAAGDTITGPALTAVWGGYVCLGLGSWIWHKLVIPARLRAHPYMVTTVTKEASGVWTVTLKAPPDQEPLAYYPGQFQFLTPGRLREEHPFTISSGGSGREHPRPSPLPMYSSTRPSTGRALAAT